jgi:hypothetical protein
MSRMMAIATTILSSNPRPGKVNMPSSYKTRRMTPIMSKIFINTPPLFD